MKSYVSQSFLVPYHTNAITSQLVLFMLALRSELILNSVNCLPYSRSKNYLFQPKSLTCSFFFMSTPSGIPVKHMLDFCMILFYRVYLTFMASFLSYPCIVFWIISSIKSCNSQMFSFFIQLTAKCIH